MESLVKMSSAIRKQGRKKSEHMAENWQKTRQNTKQETMQKDVRYNLDLHTIQIFEHKGFNMRYLQRRGQLGF